MASVWRILVVVSAGFATCAANTVAQTASRDDRNSLDKQLLDDLDKRSEDQVAPNQVPQKPTAGEDLGKPSENRSPLLEIGQQMRQIEHRLRQQDISEGTRKLQDDVLTRLTKLLEQQDQQSSGATKKQSSGQTAEAGGHESKGSTKGAPGNNPGTGKQHSSVPTPESINRWTEQMWGVLPDRVQQRMQALGNEQFLPQYEQVIQQYYERLAERNSKK